MMITIGRMATAGVLALLLIAPAAASQATTAPGGARHPRLQLVARNLRQRMRHGVRTGTITSGEATRLRSEMQALRAKARTLRQSGTAPTPEQRAQLRQERRTIGQDILRANQGTLPKQSQ